MTHETLQQLIDALDDILDRERHALIQGDLEAIGDLMLKKEALIDRINALEDTEQANLSDLREKVSRNQALLNSALEGIRAVANRMADLRKARLGSETYDQRGRKKSIGAHGNTKIEKRA